MEDNTRTPALSRVNAEEKTSWAPASSKITQVRSVDVSEAMMIVESESAQKLKPAVYVIVSDSLSGAISSNTKGREYLHEAFVVT